jgi:hypothetical protein
LMPSKSEFHLSSSVKSTTNFFFVDQIYSNNNSGKTEFWKAQLQNLFRKRRCSHYWVDRRWKSRGVTLTPKRIF